MVEVTGEQSAEPQSYGFGLGLAAGALAAVPALARGGSVALVGVALCSMALAAPICVGLRRLGSGFLTWLSLTLTAALVPLAVFAEWLVKTTHHRPLGAVTFAVFALALVCGAGLVARRLLAFDVARKSFAKWLVVALLLVDVLVVVRARPTGWVEAGTWVVLVVLASLVPNEALVRMPNRRVQAGMWLLTFVVATVWAAVAPASLAQASAVLSFPVRAFLGQA